MERLQAVTTDARVGEHEVVLGRSLRDDGAQTRLDQLLECGPLSTGQLLSLAEMVHDARIAAICVAHGVDELWSADRDFGRFDALRVRNPLTK